LDLDCLQAYLNERKQIQIKRSRSDKLLIAQGLRWRQQESWFSQESRLEPNSTKPERPLAPNIAEKGANERAIETPYTTPPPDSVVICLEQLGPLWAQSYPGKQLVPH
jgi:hypothetical protein